MLFSASLSYFTRSATIRAGLETPAGFKSTSSTTLKWLYWRQCEGQRRDGGDAEGWAFGKRAASDTQIGEHRADPFVMLLDRYKTLRTKREERTQEGP